MRLLYFLTIFLLCTSLFSQDLPINEEGKIEYSEIIEVKDTPKDILYSKVIEWFTLRYNSANDVIQLKDQKMGKVIGKGLFKIKYFARDPSIYHTISVHVKDSRYKYSVSGLKYIDKKKSEFELESFPKSWGGKKKLYKKIDINIKKILEDLKNFIAKTPKSDDW